MPGPFAWQWIYVRNKMSFQFREFACTIGEKHSKITISMQICKNGNEMGL